MKKVAIFGSYNGGSIGDTAILLGLIFSLERIYGSNLQLSVLVMKKIDLPKEIEQFGFKIDVNEIIINKVSHNSGLIGIFLNKLTAIKSKILKQPIIDLKKVKNSLIGKDYLFIGGGNLIMDLYPAWPKILKGVCDSAKIVGTDYSFIGVGAAPINDADNSANILKECLANANEVYFRDNESRNFCQRNLNFTNSSIIPDLALGFGNIIATKNYEREYVLFNIASVYGDNWPEKNQEKYELYINGMALLANYVSSKISLCEIVVFNSNYPTDKTGSRDFIKKFRSKNRDTTIRFVDGQRKVSELIELAQRAKFAFVTRLHAGIIAALGGCNVIAVAYQPKVRDVLIESGITNSIISMGNIMDGKGFEETVHAALNNNFSTHTYDAYLYRIDRTITNILESF